MSEPMKVTVTSITAVRASARIEKATWTLPAWNQTYCCCRRIVSRTLKSVRKERTQAATAPAMHGQWLCPRRKRLPRSRMVAAPRTGRKGMSQRWFSDMSDLARLAGLRAGRRQLWLRLGGNGRRQGILVDDRLQARLAQVLPDADIERVPAVIEDDDHGQGDGGLAGSDGDDEERQHLSAEIGAKACEGDEVEGHALQHRLDRQDHEDQIAARQEADGPEDEEHRADDRVAFERHRAHRSPSPRRPAIAIAPMVATSRSTPAISTGIRYSVNRMVPRAATLRAGKRSLPSN